MLKPALITDCTRMQTTSAEAGEAVRCHHNANGDGKECRGAGSPPGEDLSPGRQGGLHEGPDPRSPPPGVCVWRGEA